MAKAKGPKRIQCYHCRHRFEVSGRAESTSCPGCNKPVFVGDIHIKGRSLHGPTKDTRTCGKITVDKNARMISETIEAHGGLECLGTIETKHCVVGGKVILGPRAKFKGGLTALSLQVELGARAQGEFAVPEDPLEIEDL